MKEAIDLRHMGINVHKGTNERGTESNCSSSDDYDGVPFRVPFPLTISVSAVLAVSLMTLCCEECERSRAMFCHHKRSIVRNCCFLKLNV